MVRWYQAGHRDLPWRRTRDPYAVWVSEVMLQQTTVRTVEGYYPAFLERFPHVEALASAPLQDVLTAWSGLGYYRRARLMHAAAREVRDRHGGRFPTTLEGLRGLPGVGDYTAGAVASIALDLDVPAVDGNVERVLCRLLGVGTAAGDRATRRVVDLAAAELAPGPDPGDLTQGLMELGATVCTPRAPRCPACPWQEPCAGNASGDPERFPAPKARAARREMHVGLALAWDGDRVWMARGAEDGLFGGLLGLPASPELDVTPSWTTDVVEPVARRALARAHPWLRVGPLLAATRRTLTHRDLVLWSLAARLGRGRVVPTDWVAVDPRALRGIPLSTAMRVAVGEAVAGDRARGRP